MKKILTTCLVVVSLFVAAIFIFKIPANTAFVYGRGEKLSEDHSKH